MGMIRNLAKIRQMTVERIVGQNQRVREGYGKLIVEALQDVQRQMDNVSLQTNANLQGQQNAAPPPLNAIHVDGGAGIYHVYLTDHNADLYRGAEHTAYYSTSPNFTADFHPVHMGPSRDLRVNLGLPGPFYWAAHHGYGPSSPPSPLIYFGGSTPIPVSGGGLAAPPLRSGQGSGTNFANQPPGGYGQNPFRGTSPPRRA